MALVPRLEDLGKLCVSLSKIVLLVLLASHSPQNGSCSDRQHSDFEELGKNLLI